MFKTFTTSNEDFTLDLTIASAVYDGEIASDLVAKIEDFVANEEKEHREELQKDIVTWCNNAFRSHAVLSVVYSDDMMRDLANGVICSRITVGEGNALNVGTSEKAVTWKDEKTGKKVTEYRPDWIQYSEVVRKVKDLEAEAKKDGYKDFKIILSSDLNPRQEQLLTVTMHNYCGEISDKDRRRISGMGEDFTTMLATSATKRLEALTFWYELFNSHTGKDLKPIGKIVKLILQDKRLATFDSVHYRNTIAREDVMLSVLLSHYNNSGKRVADNSRSKSLSTIRPEEAQTQTEETPAESEA